MVAAVAVCAAIALPVFYYHGTGFSLANDLPAAYSLEPIGVAILSLCAGIMMMVKVRVSGWWWLAAGVLLAFGVQTILLFWGYQFGNSPPQTAGSAGLVGMAGGLMLVAAGVLGAVGTAAGKAAPYDPAGSQGTGDSPTIT